MIFSLFIVCAIITMLALQVHSPFYCTHPSSPSIHFEREIILDTYLLCSLVGRRAYSSILEFKDSQNF